MMIYSPLSSLFNSFNLFPSSRTHADRSSRETWLRIPTLVISIALSGLFGCEKPERCTVNSECGTEHLCRAGACKPKCVTYHTCEEGEACVDGACEVPTADYCSHVVPSRTPPEMGPYEPCPPGEVSVPTEGQGGAEMTGESMMMGGVMMTNMSAGDSAAGEEISTAPAGVESSAGESAGASAGAGTGEVAGGSAGESAGTAAGESAEGSAGDVIEVVGGQMD